jgi:predicted O-methyltransferase YrrM
MAGSAPRMALGRGAPSRRLASALASTAFGRIPADEREWIGRIEERRRELFSRQTCTDAGFALEPDGLPEWARPFDQSIPVFATTAFLSIPAIWGRFLMRVVRELQPRSCLELGTGVGISTAYQAAALELNGAGRLVTLDAAESWATVAREGFHHLGLEARIELRLGWIQSSVTEVLERRAPIDYAFVDAEHQEDPTRGYFETLLPYLSERAVVVFDDIGLSRLMRRGWRGIRRHDRVGTAVGLGRMGAAVVSGTREPTSIGR